MKSCNQALLFLFDRPDLIDMNTVAVQSNLANLEHAFFVAEKLGVARLLDPEGKIAAKDLAAKTLYIKIKSSLPIGCVIFVGMLTTT